MFVCSSLRLRIQIFSDVVTITKIMNPHGSLFVHPICILGYFCMEIFLHNQLSFLEYICNNVWLLDVDDARKEAEFFFRGLSH